MHTIHKHHPHFDWKNTVAAALLGVACLLSACMTGPPKLKPGLWEIHGRSVENHGAKRADFAFKLCRDHRYDSAQNAHAQNRKDCKTQVQKTAPQKFTSNSICRILGTTIASQGIATYANDSSVHSETQATYSPAIDGKSDETIIQDQNFVGACPPGMKTGDLIGADGLIRHQD